MTTRWQDHIARALEYQQTHLIEDVEALIESGEAQLWQGLDSAAVTEVVVYPRLKVMHLWLCGGDMEEIVNVMLPEAEKQALAWGCDRMTTGGRIGWNRVLRSHGFTPIAEVCAKDLQK